MVSAAVGHSGSVAGEMTVGSFLRDARGVTGMTQKEVAEEAEIGLSLYKQYEGDRCSPSLENVGRLVRVLGLDAVKLLDEVNNPEVSVVAPRGRPRNDGRAGGELKAVPVTPAARAQTELDAINKLRRVGELQALRSGKRVRQLQADLSMLEPERLYELAEAWEVNLEACRETPLLADLLSIFDDDMEEGEKVCGIVADRIIDVALLGVDLRALSDQALRRLLKEFKLASWFDLPVDGGVADDPEEFQAYLTAARKKAWQAVMRGEKLTVADQENYPRRH
jgi:transcriptional regulator with XRE-family HTH domain